MNDTAMERELDWDDTIEKESGEYVLLPEGDYPFLVESFDRARHAGSEKLPPCNKAILHLRITGDNGQETVLTHNLFLHTKTEGMLSAFFSSIGQKKKGEPLRMNWNMVTGASGRLHLGVRPYTNKDGEERKINEVKRFYPKEDNKPQFKAGAF